MYQEIKKCRICDNTHLVSITDLGVQKLTGIFPLPKESVGEGPLELVKCIGENGTGSCGLVQLRHSCSGEEMYGNNYGYRSGLNQSMVQHLCEITGEIKELVHLKSNDLVIDIGSNDSTLLRSYDLEELDLVGIDPTGSKFIKYYPDSIELVPDFFSAEKIEKVRKNKKAKVVTSIAMFYDLEEPIKFAQDISRILETDGIWVMEQSYLPSMIEAKAYDTICQEHLEFYCLRQIEWIANAAGMKVISATLNQANGGSFRLVLAKQESYYKEAANVEILRKYERDKKIDLLSTYEEFNNEIEKSKQEVINFFEKVRKEGKKVIGYGASTKGNVLLQYCDIKPMDMCAIAEVNEDKYGHVTPGTNIPIISEAEAKAQRPDYFFVLPWHFKDNILVKERKYMEESGCTFVFPLPNLEFVKR